MIKYFLPILVCFTSLTADDWHSHNEPITRFKKWDRFLFYNTDGEIQIGTVLHYPNADSHIMYIDTCGFNWHKAKWWMYLPDSPEVIK